MKSRRRQGATLGLVAVCVLVIIVVGIGCFFLAKIFGGGREVANATDAGALNIAKNVMSTKDANVGVVIDDSDPSKYPDFIQCADPLATKRITLLTYNRCVAQALLVALNAQAETAAGSTQANGNAAKVLAELTRLGTDLRAKLQDNQLTSYFDKVANDTRMWGNNPVKVDTSQANTYVTAFMKPKQSTNVYFYAASLPGSVPGTPVGVGALPGNWNTQTSSAQLKPPSGTYLRSYLAGYDNLVVPGVGSIMGVPVFPQQNPHLVAKTEFDQAATAPNTFIPPNAFSVASNSLESKSGVVGGAVAAAIVGAVKLAPSGIAVGATAPNYDWPGAIPGGYIEISNPAGSTLPAGYRGLDQNDNIFNWELYNGPGIEISPIGANGAAYTTNVGAVSAWADYNNSTGTDANGHDATKYPPTLGYANNTIFTTTQASAAGTTSSSDLTLLTIKSKPVNCLTLLQQNNWGYPCDQFLSSMEGAYGRTPLTPNGSNPLDSLPIYSNVDLVKGQVIAAFQSGAKSVNITAPAGQSGLGVYPNGVTGSNPTPYFDAPIQRTGTIDALLDQVTSSSVTQVNANCKKASILNAMSERCAEIKPDATPAEIAALWQQDLPMGKTFYVYLNTTTNKLVISETQPPTYKGAAPDGNPNDTNVVCVSQYGLTGNLVDVPIGGLPADDNLHEVPYTQHSATLLGSDHANWTYSSGYQNLLGKLQFANTTSGGVENFSRPN
jgi:hypothetical protein